MPVVGVAARLKAAPASRLDRELGVWGVPRNVFSLQGCRPDRELGVWEYPETALPCNRAGQVEYWVVRNTQKRIQPAGVQA